MDSSDGFVYEVKTNANKKYEVKTNANIRNTQNEEIFEYTEIFDESKIDTLLKTADFKNLQNKKKQSIVLDNSDDFMHVFNTDLKNEIREENELKENKLPKNKRNKKSINLFNPAKFFQNIDISNCSKEQFLNSLISHTGTYLKRRERTEIYEIWTNEIIKGNFFEEDLNTEQQKIEEKIKSIDQEIEEIQNLFNEILNEGLEFELEDHKTNIVLDVSINDLPGKDIFKKFSNKVDLLVEENEGRLSDKISFINDTSKLLSPHYLMKQMCLSVENDVISQNE